MSDGARCNYCRKVPCQCLGSGPIEPTQLETMNEVARALDATFNGDARGKVGERSTGFILLVFPFGDTGGRCNYISNGANRSDVIRLMREQANRFDEGTQ